MRAERLEGLLGPVGGGRQTVGAEAHPREQRDQRDFVKDGRIEFALPAKQEALDTYNPGLPEVRESRCWGRHRSLLEAYGVS